MGIKQLFSIIKDEAPDAIKEGEIKNQFGRKVAIVSLLSLFPLPPINLTFNLQSMLIFYFPGCVRLPRPTPIPIINPKT